MVKFPAIMEPEKSLPGLMNVAFVSFLELVEFSLQRYPLIIWKLFWN
jgi:hypothetical protein